MAKRSRKYGDSLNCPKSPGKARILRTSGKDFPKTYRDGSQMNFKRLGSRIIS